MGAQEKCEIMAIKMPETPSSIEDPENKKSPWIKLGVGAAGLAAVVGGYLAVTGGDKDKATEPKQEPVATASVNPSEQTPERPEQNTGSVGSQLTPEELQEYNSSVLRKQELTDLYVSYPLEFILNDMVQGKLSTDPNEAEDLVGADIVRAVTDDPDTVRQIQKIAVWAADGILRNTAEEYGVPVTDVKLAIISTVQNRDAIEEDDRYNDDGDPVYSEYADGPDDDNMSELAIMAATSSGKKWSYCPEGIFHVELSGDGRLFLASH